MPKKKITKDVIVESFSSNFKADLSEQEMHVGIESEFPVVDVATGKAPPPEVVDKVFKEFIAKGWSPIVDQGTKKIVSLEKVVDGSSVTFGTDVGRCTIEIAFPPAQNLFQAYDFRKLLVIPAARAFARHGAAMLGYGILPVDLPSKDLMAEKGRYRFFEADSSNTFVPPQDGVDLHVFSLTASAQTHVEVDKKNAVRMLNMLTCLSGVLLTLGANTPVWRGEVDQDNCRAVREWLWEAGWPTRANQVGMLRPINSFEDYVDTILSFRPQMIKRDEYLSLQNVAFSNRELFEKGTVKALNVSGKKVEVTLRPEDFSFMNGFAWYNARMTPYGTIESRIVCQQPADEPFAISALTLGLAANLDRAEELVKTHDFIFWRQLRYSALYRGFYDPHIIELAHIAYEIAREGLEKRAYGEEEFLVPLKRRLRDLQAPADRVRAVFEKKGIEGLIEYTMI